MRFRVLASCLAYLLLVASVTFAGTVTFRCGNHTNPQHAAASIPEVKELVRRHGCTDWDVTSDTAMTAAERDDWLKKLEAELSSLD